MSRVEYVGTGVARFTLDTGERVTFVPKEPREVSQEDMRKLLEMKNKGCDCHNQPPTPLFRVVS